MIIFVSSFSHRRTHRIIQKSLKEFEVVSYPQLFRRRRLPVATYIFSDFDRMNFIQLEMASNFYWQLKDAGCRVLNNPALALNRLALLRRLYRAGLNSFQAWGAEELGEVDAFPVFLRTRAAHRGTLTGLIEDQAQLKQQLDEMTRRGHPLSDLMIVEYRAEPFEGDIFRKLSMYKIGDEILAAPTVHEKSWAVKYGAPGVASEAAYDDDLARVRDVPYRGAVQQVFEAADIDYGRVDFGLVKGRPEFYEINTNPSIEFSNEHPNSDRLMAINLVRQRYLEVMQGMDMDGYGRMVNITPPKSFRVGRWSWRKAMPGYSWLP